MTDIKWDDVIVSERVSYIHYLIQLQKREKEVSRTLTESSSKVNARTPAYAKQLDLQIRQPNIRAQKMDSSSLETFKRLIASF